MAPIGANLVSVQILIRTRIDTLTGEILRVSGVGRRGQVLALWMLGNQQRD